MHIYIISDARHITLYRVTDVQPGPEQRQPSQLSHPVLLFRMMPFRYRTSLWSVWVSSSSSVPSQLFLHTQFLSGKGSERRWKALDKHCSVTTKASEQRCFFFLMNPKHSTIPASRNKMNIQDETNTLKKKDSYRQPCKWGAWISLKVVGGLNL